MMATLSHAESRRLYSWWWDSHISPKNSKWLQENLTDMDIKVKAMIKLIEEDADSFRKKAEMYYRKRPELMKLVEEFYRAYRALAERYDHATGALRQAHQTMAEAFPDQIPLILPDESPADFHTPEMFKDMHKGVPGMSSHSNAFKRNGVFSEESDATMSKEETREKLSNGRARKGLNFQNGNELQQEAHLLSDEKQNLKNQIAHESERADKAEAEVENLKGAISKLESEKNAIFLQNQLSQAKLSSLEAAILRTQEGVKKVNDEMLVGVTKMRDIDDRCNQLEENKQSLQLELDMLNETVKKQEGELDTKKEELEKLNISIKEKHERFMEAEMLHSQSQEEVKVLSLEIQNWVEKLRKMEMIKVSLEEEIRSLKEEICNLNEQIDSSALKIKSLQDEISLLKESKRKLVAEVGLYVEEKESLQQDKKDLEQRHNELKEKIVAVNLNVESLQAMVKELRDGNVELKELCKKHEYERVLHLENLKFMEKITEQNAALEFSLSNANAELKELREKVKTLEESCETLHRKISMHISEKAVLVSQVEAIAHNMENLSKKNTLLENSLSDVNFEIEGLRGKFNSLEESCHSLKDLNSSLLAEKSALVNHVESISYGMGNLESRYAELEGKNLNLEREKDHILRQVTELQHSLRTKKEEFETLRQSTKNQLDTLENHIRTLQDKGQLDDEEIEVLNHKIINAQMELFILQRILYDMKENNMLVSYKCQKYLETSMCQEELISELKCDIENLKTSILKGEDENEHHILEKSVFVTLLEQLILDVAELQSAKNFLECESKTRFEELLVFQGEKHQLQELNEQLRQNVQTCNQREEALKVEMDIFGKNLSDLQAVHSTLQSYMANLIEENQYLSKKVNDLTLENDTLEERNTPLVAEIMNLEHLSLVFRNHNAERALDLQLLSKSMDQLCGVNSGLEQKIKSLNEHLGAVEVENMNLKELVVKLEDEAITVRNTCQELNHQMEIRKNLLVQKDLDLSQVNHEFQAVQDKNTELSGNLDEAKVAREELWKKILTLMEYNTHRDDEIVGLHQANDTLNWQLGKLRGKVEEIIERGNQEAKYYEEEIETLLTDIHTATISAAIFEDKMIELLITCEGHEISAMIQKEMFYEEIGRRNAYEDKMREKFGALDGENRGLKEQLSAYLPLLLSLGDLVASLERHILSLANDHLLSNQEKQQQKSNDEGNEGHQTTSALGISVLENLRAKVDKLEIFLTFIESHPERKRFDSKATLQAAVKESELSKSKGTTYLEAASIGKDVILHLKKNEETGEEKFEEKTNDIQLDHVARSSQYGNGATSSKPTAIDSDETNDQLIELWVTVEKDESKPSSKIEAEKKLSFDKLELAKEVTESHQDRSSNISERLSFDAQKLSILQRSAKELKSTMENSELNINPISFEFKKVKAQLKEAESAISHSIDTNTRLTKKAGKLSSSSEIAETGSTGERKISERVRRGSEKIVRLELELQKLEYIWLKLKEEHDYKRARAAERRTRVLLRDYLYGRRESPRRKKVCCCACIRPRTKDGYSS